MTHHANPSEEPSTPLTALFQCHHSVSILASASRDIDDLLKSVEGGKYPGAVYHVMCRGDRREAIFLKRIAMVFATLAEMCARTGIAIHSYVLLSNHYHLRLETPEANLVAGMQWPQDRPKT